MESVSAHVGRQGLDFTTDQEDAQHGGFVVGAQVQIESPAGLGGGPNFWLYFKGEWRLFDGRLTVQGEVLNLVGQGSGFGDIQARIPTALTREMDAPLAPGASPSTLTEGVWSQAYSKQRFNGIPKVQPPFTTCASRPDGRVVVSPTDPAAPCEPWRKFIRDQLTGGPNALVKPALSSVGATVIGLSSDEQNEVLTEFDATETIGGDTVWKNVRCADLGDIGPNSLPVGPACYYEIPARRINDYPDGVELIFLDQLKELDNPVYPIWLMLLEFEAEGQTSTLSPLCDDAIAQPIGTLSTTRLIGTQTTTLSLSALPTAPDTTFFCDGPAFECPGVSASSSCCCNIILTAP